MTDKLHQVVYRYPNGNTHIFLAYRHRTAAANAVDRMHTRATFYQCRIWIKAIPESGYGGTIIEREE